MKTPLKSKVNFKSGAILKEKIPPYSVVSSFLLYSGQLELGLVAANRLVVAHTNKFVIYDFWLALKEEPDRVVGLAQELTKDPLFNQAFFRDLQEHWFEHNDPATRAAWFFILNRCSDSPYVSRGRFQEGGITPIAVNYLKRLQLANFHLYLDTPPHVEEALNVAEESDYLLLPVGTYSRNIFEEGKNKGPEETTLYHQSLSAKLQNMKKKWVVVYKFHSDLLKLYKGSNITMLTEYGRPTQDTERCEELLIANF